MLTIDVNVDEQARTIRLRTSIRFHGNRFMVLGNPGDLVNEAGQRMDSNGNLGEFTVYKSPGATFNGSETAAEAERFSRLADYYSKLSNKYGFSAKSGIPDREAGDVVIDKTWIKSRFMVPKVELHPIDAMNADVSVGSWKYTNTTLGNTLPCNPRPQFNRYADIKLRSVSRVVADRVHGVGEAPRGYDGDYTMGRYYSEAIDDNSMLVFLQFGVPKFNNLLMFIIRSVSYEDTYIANHGKIPTGYHIGKWAGTFLRFCAFPLMSIAIWGVKSLFELFLGGQFSYYYLDPAMHTYWSTVTQLVNQLASDLGILPAFMQKEEGTASGKMGIPAAISKEHMADMNRIFPHFYNNTTGYIDVFAIALSAQDKMSAIMKGEMEYWGKLETGPKHEDFAGYVARGAENLDELNNLRGDRSSSNPGLIAKLDGLLTFGSFIKSTSESHLKEGTSTYRGDAGKPAQSSETLNISKETQDEVAMAAGAFKREKDGRYINPEVDPGKIKDADAKWQEKFARFFSSAARDGGGYAVFRVDYIGSVSDSWSNSSGDIEAEGLIKSAAQGARNVSFNLGGGNILPGMNDILTQVNNVVMGFLDGVSFNTMSTIAAVLNGAFVQLPKKWEDSDFSPASNSYSFTLISPYGNIYSQLQNIYIPLCMLLAGACPQATGKSSYSSPFLCSLFNKGVQDIRLGMITSLSVTRGTSNLGFNRLRRPLAIEVSFTVTDFNIKPAAPVNPSIFSFKDFNLELDDQQPMSIYLATLASRDLYTQKYTMPKVKLKIARIATSLHRMVSPATTAMWMGNSPLAQNTIGLFGQHRVLNVSLLNPNT